MCEFYDRLSSFKKTRSETYSEYAQRISKLKYRLGINILRAPLRKIGGPLHLKDFNSKELYSGSGALTLLSPFESINPD